MGVSVSPAARHTFRHGELVVLFASCFVWAYDSGRGCKQSAGERNREVGGSVLKTGLGEGCATSLEDGGSYKTRFLSNLI